MSAQLQPQQQRQHQHQHQCGSADPRRHALPFAGYRFSAEWLTETEGLP